MKKVTIIGAGSWGSALANILIENNHEVLLYDQDLQTVTEINTTHTNRKLPQGSLDEQVKATSCLREALAFSDYVILSIPTKVMRLVLMEIAETIKAPKLFVNTSKGLEPDTFKRVSELVMEIIPAAYCRGFVALTGPSHAEEVIIKLPTTICAVSTCLVDAKEIQELFSNHLNFRVYTGNDLVGSELCGAIKNIYAIASGMLEGVGYGDNARAGLITRALVEMRRLVTALGAKDDTIFGLTGVGDLIVTTTSHHSRNFQAGVKLASGVNLADTIASMTMVVEGVRTTKAAYDLAKSLAIDTPIINAVYRVLYEKVPVREAISELMMRSFKEE